MKKILLFLLIIFAVGYSQLNVKYFKDSWNQNFPVMATIDSNNVTTLVNTSKSFELAVSMGELDGFSTLDKFGSNPLVLTTSDPEDIWEGGGIYPYDQDSTAPIISIASSNAGDNQLTKIEGLDSLGNEVSQLITLNGTNRVALDSNLWRVYRVENEGTTDYLGDVFVYTGTGTVPSIGDPEVRAVVINGNNQTLMALYTIPKGKVGFLYRGEIGIQWEGTGPSKTEFARIFYKSRRYGKVFKIKKDITCMSDGNSLFQDSRSFPDVIPSLTDIKLQLYHVSADMGGWAAFDMLLVDEKYFKKSFLQAIGQPGY